MPIDCINIRLNDKYLLTRFKLNLIDLKYFNISTIIITSLVLTYNDFRSLSLFYIPFHQFDNVKLFFSIPIQVFSLTTILGINHIIIN